MPKLSGSGMQPRKPVNMADSRPIGKDTFASAGFETNYLPTDNLGQSGAVPVVSGNLEALDDTSDHESSSEEAKPKSCMSNASSRKSSRRVSIMKKVEVARFHTYGELREVAKKVREGLEGFSAEVVVQRRKEFSETIAEDDLRVIADLRNPATRAKALERIEDPFGEPLGPHAMLYLHLVARHVVTVDRKSPNWRSKLEQVLEQDLEKLAELSEEEAARRVGEEMAKMSAA